MSTPPRSGQGALKRTAGSAGRGRAGVRAVTGGAGEEGAKEEEEGVRIVNREVVAGFEAQKASTPPISSWEEGVLVGRRHTSHRGICLRKTIILGGGW